LQSSLITVQVAPAIQSQTIELQTSKYFVVPRRSSYAANQTTRYV
jgi:hypothetical protein